MGRRRNPIFYKRTFAGSENMKNKHIHGWTIFLIVVCLIFSLYNLSNTPKEEIPSGVTTQPPSSLYGWEEECVQYKTIEKYALVEPPTCESVCSSVYACMQNLYPEIEALHTQEEFNNAVEKSACISEGKCYNLCKEKLVPKTPYVKFWNESICTKQILVKVT